VPEALIEVDLVAVVSSYASSDRVDRVGPDQEGFTPQPRRAGHQ